MNLQAELAAAAREMRRLREQQATGTTIPNPSTHDSTAQNKAESLTHENSLYCDAIKFKNDCIDQSRCGNCLNKHGPSTDWDRGATAIRKQALLIMQKV